MIINKEKFRKEIFEKIFNQNYNKCAKAICVEPAQLHRFLNKNGQAGALMLGGFYSFCERNNLPFRDFIFLPEPSTVVYENNIKHTATVEYRKSA